MASGNPEQTKQLLNGNPSLTYAIFQAMVMMNLIDSNMIQQIMSMSSSSLAATTTSTLPPPPPPPSSTVNGKNISQANSAATATTTATAATFPSTQQQPPPPMSVGGIAPVNAEQQRALIMQIMNLTTEQINALPAQQREQVIQLRAQLQQQQQQQQR